MCEVVKLFMSCSMYIVKLFKACDETIQVYGSNCSRNVVKLFMVSRDDALGGGVINSSEMIHTQ